MSECKSSGSTDPIRRRHFRQKIAPAPLNAAQAAALYIGGASEYDRRSPRQSFEFAGPTDSAQVPITTVTLQPDRGSAGHWIAESHEWSIHDNEVHVWRIDVAQQRTRPGQLREWLAPEDLDRAARLRMEMDRDRCLIGRAHLRRLLGIALALPPRSVPIRADEFGKPYLPCAPMQFNLSHSGNFVLFSICRSARVGIDVECVRALDNVEGMAQIVLAPSERDDVLCRSGDDRQRTFLRYWTCKEAYAKGRGMGMSLDFRTIEFTLRDGAALAGGSANRPWRVVELDVAGNYASAVAVEAEDFTLVQWDVA